MTAIILAAGRGSRMNDLTESNPKCFLELDGQPLLRWQIKALRAAGIKDIIVVGGYRYQLLENKEYTLLVNHRWDQTNMVMTLCEAHDALSKSECIISYADIAYHPDIVKQLMNATEDINITYDQAWRELWELRFDNPLADAETFKITDKQRITEIGNRAQSLDEIQGQFMGLIKTTPVGWKTIKSSLDELDQKQQDKMDMTSLLKRLIAQEQLIHGVGIKGRWIEADNQEDLNFYQNHLNNTRDWSHDWRWMSRV